MEKLTIDESLLSLVAWHFRNEDTPPPNPPAGAFATRTATGGRKPYTYHSSNNTVVDIDKDTGKVISRGNGGATITVTDSDRQTASYPVQASSVHYVFGTGIFGTYTSCADAATAQGGSIPSLAEWRSYRDNYQGADQPDEWCWTSTRADKERRWAINPKSGEEKQLLDIAIGGGTANGFGMRLAPTL
ncbi:Ig-like domain-containing protein [Pseudomonas sp. W15Feb9B]|uniref:Ig-like domain-containing protein n=1 Tax=Pseudomonas sp. W15Feb9B TaxID=550743 RepID=UPI00059737B8|nr:Ig-like domain-containing protein [Pseudomonas sp. W15Feb9B]KIK84387.1 hypothetical protein OC71_20785 [Pseudomonas sp. W15Feb9B]